MARSVLSIGILGVLLLVSVTPLSPEIRYSWGFHIQEDPFHFAVECTASSTASEIRDMSCRGYHLSTWTSTCQDKSTAWDLWCMTPSASVTCPEGGGTFPMTAFAWGIIGDEPSQDEETAYFECGDSGTGA